MLINGNISAFFNLCYSFLLFLFVVTDILYSVFLPAQPTNLTEVISWKQHTHLLIYSLVGFEPVTFNYRNEERLGRDLRLQFPQKRGLNLSPKKGAIMEKMYSSGSALQFIHFLWGSFLGSFKMKPFLVLCEFDSYFLGSLKMKPFLVLCEFDSYFFREFQHEPLSCVMWIWFLFLGSFKMKPFLALSEFYSYF